MLSNEELASILESGYEPRGVERKRGQSLDDSRFVENVACAAMALANQRDGGHILIGVEDQDQTGESSGLDEDLVTQWLDYDQVTAKLNRWADPPLRIEVARRELPSGGAVVVMQVDEFDQIPVICKRDGARLKQGQIYTRSMAKPESSAAITQNELRELLNLAAEKQTRRFIETAQRAGLRVRTEVDPHGGFQEQTLAWEQAATRVLVVPHLNLIVHPLAFEAERIKYGHLSSVAQEITVRMRGWPLPFIQHPSNGDDWVGEVHEGSEGESWRLHDSGLFLHAQAIPTHFQREWRQAGDQPPATLNFPVWLPVAFLTEAFTLAARLQRTLDPDAPVQITVAAEGIQGAMLVAANPHRAGFHARYVFGSPGWRRSFPLSPEDALTGVRDLAVDYAKNFLQRFGWDGATTEMVQGMQEEIFGPSQ